MQKKGFTLIELLVVIAIIALLSTLAVVALSSARQKSRDAKRLADIKQVQTALELYFTDQNGYPAGTGTVLGGANAGCLGAGGFAASACTEPIYMGKVPTNPTPGGVDYTYTVSGTSYTINFTLEGVSGGLALGAHTASPAGIQ
ncbi:MAG: type II secretion system protein [Candidatus Magasanikbacteria bacterium]|nr:type II secretion system protein [Candidatus Magasanikbacteria bacterium]